MLFAPIEILRNWDFSVSKESIAMTLAHYYGTHYVRDGVRPSGLKFIELMQSSSDIKNVVKKEFSKYNINYSFSEGSSLKDFKRCIRKNKI